MFNLTHFVLPSSLLRDLLLGAALLGAAPGLQAQGYPRNPINLVIALAPGDAADIAGRAMAEELSRLLNVPVVPVNRPGAGGSLATGSVVKAPKDGYTILFVQNGALTFRPVLDRQAVPYEALKDLTPLGLSTRIPTVLTVRGDAPFKNFNELVEFSKKNPGKMRVGVPGIGAAGDFGVQIINSLTGAGITTVPFTGASPAVTALRGGHVEGAAMALGALSGHLKSGAMTGIVISSKFPEFPNVPTLTELGYSQNLFGIWLAFFAPAGVPAEVTSAWIAAIEQAVKAPAIASKLLPLGIVQDYSPPDKLITEIREEYRRVEDIAKKAGLVK